MYKHDGSNALRDVIYTETCDKSTGTSHCCVDSIMLIFGPDNACGEGVPDYYTMYEGGSFVGNAASIGTNEYMKK